MSAALKLDLFPEQLSEKPRLEFKQSKPKLVWTNPNLSPGSQKENYGIKPKGSYGRVLYNWNRYYDPRIGRYITSDPIGLYGGGNTYDYSRQNALSSFDYFGLKPGDLFNTFDDAWADGFEYIDGLDDGGVYMPAVVKVGECYTYSLAEVRHGMGPDFGGIGKIGRAIKGGIKKLSKVKKEVREETIGDGKFTKKTKVFPGKGPGQSRSEMEFVKNSDGRLIRSRKFSYDRGNKFQNKKPARGGPEGRPANEN